MTLEAQFQQLKQLMCASIGLDEKQLSLVQQTVVFAHFATKQVGMKCIDRKGDIIQFPECWHKDFEGVYKFTYQIQKKNGKKVLFRFVDAGEGEGKITVNFVEEDQDELHQIQIKYSQTNFEQNMKKYVKKIEESLKLKPEEKKQEKSNPLQVRRLQPQWRTPQENPYIRNPLPFNPPPRQSNEPFGMPFQGDEYVGPDSSLFAGRGNMQNMQRPNMRRPPGSRFDPIDPFGNQGFGDDPGSRDFSGFNNWGQPFGGNGGGGKNFYGFH